MPLQCPQLSGCSTSFVFFFSFWKFKRWKSVRQSRKLLITVLSFSLQVPIVLPILVILAAVFLVLAPIIDKPEIEYLYVTLFILSGALVYVPFIHYKLCPGLLTKLTVFLQLILEVAPADKNLWFQKRKKERHFSGLFVKLFNLVALEDCSSNHSLLFSGA